MARPKAAQAGRCFPGPGPGCGLGTEATCARVAGPCHWAVHVGLGHCGGRGQLGAGESVGSAHAGVGRGPPCHFGPTQEKQEPVSVFSFFFLEN